MEQQQQARTSRWHGVLVYTMLGLLAFWVFGGFVALYTLDWPSYSFTQRGHMLTIWLMVAFGLVGSVYLFFALVARLTRVTPMIIVLLVVVLEVILAMSYNNW